MRSGVCNNQDKIYLAVNLVVQHTASSSVMAATLFTAWYLNNSWSDKKIVKCNGICTYRYKYKLFGLSRYTWLSFYS